VALVLQRKGITRVHPLEGGLRAWMDLGYPVEPMQPPILSAAIAPSA